MTVGLTIGMVGILTGLILGALGLFFRQGVVELGPAAHRRRIRGIRRSAS